MNTCDSIHWYDGDACVLDAGHDGVHRDEFGLTWDKGASDRSLLRFHGPWPEVVEGAYAHVYAEVVRDECGKHWQGGLCRLPRGHAGHCQD